MYTRIWECQEHRYDFAVTTLGCPYESFSIAVHHVHFQHPEKWRIFG